MDVLKQLETKLQALVQQRNALKEEVARLKAAQGEESERLRGELEAAKSEADSLRAERESIRKDVEAILAMVEELG